jgi:hypothetical protein
MEAMNIRIGPLVFDHADADPDGDVLYLHVGLPQPAEGEETPEGHVLRFSGQPDQASRGRLLPCSASAETIASSAAVDRAGRPQRRHLDEPRTKVHISAS